jgi:hypothetical protein
MKINELSRNSNPDQEIQCVNHAIIIRNESLEIKYPGGLKVFRRRFNVNSNEHITVYCDSSNSVWDNIKEFEAIGLENGKDFASIDTVECEMWRLINADGVDRPFWFETEAEWLGCKHWNGNVLVWYNG